MTKYVPLVDLSTIIVIVYLLCDICHTSNAFNIAHVHVKRKKPHSFSSTTRNAVTETKNNGGKIVIKPSKSSCLQPLSLNPLICSSKKALLTSEECLTLSQWCRDVVEQRGKLTDEALEHGKANGQEGAQIMVRLQRILEEEVLGFHPNTSEDKDYVLPRFISYHNTDDRSLECINLGDKSDMSSLIPDGLHVDTNNSKHFRHWSILFYLDTCNSLGATTFPLAIPFVGNDGDDSDRNLIQTFIEMKENNNIQMNEIQKVAQNLILEDVQHTRMVDATEEQLKLGRIVDEAAIEVLRKQKSHDNIKNNQIDMGLRVLPKQGHFCIFSSLNADGYPNPLSFHGGEAMDIGESKEVLTFFYEVPIETFSNRKEFGERVVEREMDFMNTHFGTYLN